MIKIEVEITEEQNLWLESKGYDKGQIIRDLIEYALYKKKIDVATASLYEAAGDLKAKLFF